MPKALSFLLPSTPLPPVRPDLLLPLQRQLCAGARLRLRVIFERARLQRLFSVCARAESVDIWWWCWWSWSWSWS